MVCGMKKWPPMAFQKREEWVSPKTPEGSLGRQFEVWCGECGSTRIKAAFSHDGGNMAAVLVCQQCQVVAEIKMRAPIPKPFLARCLCRSIYVCPQGDADEGRLEFSCLDCLKREIVRVN